MLTEVQVVEWLDHPVTSELRKILTDRAQWLEESRGNCFVRGDAELTQENHLELEGRITEAGELLERLRDKETFDYAEGV